MLESVLLIMHAQVDVLAMEQLWIALEKVSRKYQEIFHCTPLNCKYIPPSTKWAFVPEYFY